jgi:HAD superfamily hydrolase (TIGR01450 family)
MARAFLLDLDGTLYSSGAAIPGVPAALATLRSRNTPCRFLTNTTSISRRGLGERLRGYGYDVAESEIITPLVTAAALLKAEGIRTVMPFVPEAALEDLKEFELVGGTATRSVTGANPPVSSVLPVSSVSPAVLIGDLGARWSFDLMQDAFAALMNGARFLALSRDRYFQSAHGLRLDAGTFVAGLEYATGRSPELVGKPGLAYYHRALESLPGAFDLGAVVMVGDDLWSDIEGAQRAGCQGWLVRTGKFREGVLEQSGIVPDRIIASAAELAEVPG